MGTFVGLLFQRHELYEDILLSTVSGGFIYIATTSMIPTLLRSKQRSLKQIFFETMAIFLGVLLMAGVLLLEDHDHDHGHGHSDTVGSSSLASSQTHHHHGDHSHHGHHHH